MIEPVILAVGGGLHGGWKEIRVTRSIEDASGSFDLRVTDRWSASSAPRAINPGDPCTVAVGGEIVITGYVDDVNVEYDATSHSIQVTGRDKTADLVDSSSSSFQVKKKSLKEIADKVAKPFGIPITDRVGVAKKFPVFKSDEAETAFETIETAARQRGVLMYADGKGGLVFDRAGTQRLSPGLVLGQNIKKGSVHKSHRDRHSEVTAKGQKATLDGWGQGDHDVMHKVTDPEVTRYRPLVILPEDEIDADDAKTRATWQRNVQAGRSLECNYTVVGWRHASGKLWTPNYLVPVTDAFGRVFGDLLICSVTFTIGAGGMLTELNLKPKEAMGTGGAPTGSKK